MKKYILVLFSLLLFSYSSQVFADPGKLGLSFSFDPNYPIYGLTYTTNTYDVTGFGGYYYNENTDDDTWFLRFIGHLKSPIIDDKTYLTYGVHLRLDFGKDSYGGKIESSIVGAPYIGLQRYLLDNLALNLKFNLCWIDVYKYQNRAQEYDYQIPLNEFYMTILF